jgi:hypothetical protein
MFNKRETACLRAALQFYIACGLDEAKNRPANLEALATADGSVEAIEALDIGVVWVKLDALLKDAKAATLAAIKADSAFVFSDFTQVYGTDASPYLQAAKSMANEGVLEVDDFAIISESADGGAYVSAWMWVSDEAAGISSHSQTLEKLTERVNSVVGQRDAKDAPRAVKKIQAYNAWLENTIENFADEIDVAAPVGQGSGAPLVWVDEHGGSWTFTPQAALNELVEVASSPLAGEDTEELAKIRECVALIGPVLDRALASFQVAA